MPHLNNRLLLVAFLAFALGWACSEPPGVGGSTSTSDAGGDTHQASDTQQVSDTPQASDTQQGSDTPQSSCGGLDEACCTGQQCDDNLGCEAGVCVEQRAGEYGKACSRNSDCSSGLCLPLDDGRTVCTTACSTTGDCLAGWECEPLLGESSDVCQCEVQPESCNGLDDDCDGVVDNGDEVSASCPGAEACQGGECVCVAMCAGDCVDLTSDEANCGSCGNQCDRDATCEAGQCICGTGLDECDGACVNRQQDTQHCGQCGKTCAINESCEDGQCVRRKPQVTAGPHHSCGVKTDGTVACWGNLSNVSVPSGQFIQVSSGGPPIDHHGPPFSCGLKTDGTIECWGRMDNPEALQGQFVQVSAGNHIACGLKPNGTVVCWDEFGIVYDFGTSEPLLSSGPYTQVSSGSSVCGLRSDGSVDCGGAPTSEQFVQIAVGLDSHVCGVKTDGTVSCWGNDAYGVASPNAGQFLQVSGGQYHTCGVKTDGTIECWGASHVSLQYGQTEPPNVAQMGDSYIGVTAGYFHTCGTTDAGQVLCWGRDDHGQTTVPTGF